MTPGVLQALSPVRRSHGFTLIELLVAISLLALMATLAWRGLDGMTRSQARMSQYSQEVLALQAGLGQWGADLDALAEQPDASSLEWDGRVLRILRSGSAGPGEGLRVVGWSRREIDGVGQWLRWQSSPVTTRPALQRAWQEAGLWGQNASGLQSGREVRIAPLDQWQIYYYRGDAWSNPLSSVGTTGTVQDTEATKTVGTTGASSIPDGVRLVLTLSPGQAISGALQRDWVRPIVGGGR